LAGTTSVTMVSVRTANGFPPVTSTFLIYCCTILPVALSYLNFFKFTTLLGLYGVKPQFHSSGLKMTHWELLLMFSRGQCPLARHHFLEPLQSFFMCSSSASLVAASSVLYCSTVIDFYDYLFSCIFFVVSSILHQLFCFCLASSIFLFFSTTSSLFFWTFSFFLIFLSVVGSSSLADSECVDVVVADVFDVSSSSSFFVLLHGISLHQILPIGFPFLLVMTSSYVWHHSELPLPPM
jgi:hypothetical protein